MPLLSKTKLKKIWPMLPILMPRIHDPIFMEIDSGLKKIIFYKGLTPLLGGLQ